MPDEQSLPILPPDETPSWLARNRKLVILGGVAVILLVVAGVTYLLPRLRQTADTSVTNTTNTINTSTDGVTNTTTAPTSTRPTFQRSTVANVSTAPPPVYQPPTPEQTRQAIEQQQTITNTSP